MPTPQELEAEFWKSLKSDMTVMLGLAGVEQGHAQPMTAQLDDANDGRGPVWFFTSRDNGLVQAMRDTHAGFMHFASKGHDLFASVQGTLVSDNNPATIDRLWNKWVAAWFEGGKDDPKVQLLRFDADSAEIWEDGSSLVAGLKTLLGRDPKQDYHDKVATVAL